MILANLAPLALALGAVLFLSCVGLAILLLVTPTRLSAYLPFAPTIGYAATIILCLQGNIFGAPVKSFGLPMVLVLLALSLCVIIRSRRQIRTDVPTLLLIFVPILFLCFGLVAYGYNWVSFSTEDSATYILNANRLFNHAYFFVPSVSDAAYNQHAGDGLFAFTAVNPYRPGADLAVSLTMAVSGRSALELYMVVSLIGQVCLTVAAAGLLPISFGRSRGLGSLAMCSFPMSAYAFLYQRTPQIFGVAVTCAFVVVISDSISLGEGKSRRESCILAGLLFAAFEVTYFELSPILVIALFTMVFHAIVSRVKLKSIVGSLVSTLSIGVVTLAGFIPIFCLTFIGIFKLAATGGAGGGVGEYPEFVIPRSIADLWGFTAMYEFVQDPSLAIALALICTILAAAAVVFQLRAGAPRAIISGIMLVLIGDFILKQHGFEVWKLEMYVQPFLATTVIFALWSVISKLRCRKPHLTLALVFVCGTLILQGRAWLDYMRNANDLAYTGAGYPEIHGASKAAVSSDLSHIRAMLDPNVIVTSDASTLPLQKYENIGLDGRRYVSVGYSELCCGAVSTSLDFIPFFRQLVTERQVVAAFMARERKPRKFAFGASMASFSVPVIPKKQPVEALLSGPSISVINRSSQVQESGPITAVPLNRAVDWLVPIDSSLSKIDPYGPHFSDDPRFHAISNVTRDYFFPASTFSIAGRYVLFQVLSPRKSSRIKLDITKTVLVNRALPSLQIFGAASLPMKLMGICSARAYSGEIAPKLIEQDDYLGLKFDNNGEVLDVPRSGLMKLFNAKLPLDPRLKVALVRDISYVPDDWYEARSIPERVTKFPDGLAGDFSYSGLCEDGWVGSAASIELRARDKDRFHVRGLVPMVSSMEFRTTISVLVDGVSIVARKLGPGYFDVATRPVSPGIHDVEVQFDRAQVLPHGDNRRVGAFLSSLGFEASN